MRKSAQSSSQVGPFDKTVREEKRASSMRGEHVASICPSCKSPTQEQAGRATTRTIYIVRIYSRSARIPYA
jgi:hypothetical protein